MPKLSVSLVLQLLHDISEKNGKKTGQEERELYFARIFGYHAIALSGLLQTCTLDDIKLMTDSSIAFGSEKDYLKQAASFVLLSILKACETHELAKEISETILKSYLKDGVSTPEHVWFVLEGQKSFEVFGRSCLL